MSTPATPDESPRLARRFVWTWLASVAAAVLVVFPGVTFALLNWYDDPGLRWIDEVRARKFHATELAGAGGRILIAGGSSAAFSVDAELLEAKLGLPAVNIASHGALGLNFLLDDARRVARPGDLVLLHLEYAQYHRQDTELSEIERKYLWTYEPRRFAHLPALLATQQIYGNPWSDYVASRERWSRRRHGGHDAGNPEVWRHYSFVNMSSRGDFRADVPGMAEIEPLKLVEPEAIGPDAARQLEDFFAWCQRRNVRVAGVLPGMLRAPSGQEAEVASIFGAVRDFYTTHHIPVLGNPELLQWPREYLFDTRYHANAAGRRLRTEALVPDLAQLLGLTRPNGEPAIFLVRARAAGFAHELALADRAVDCRYVNATGLDHPWSITPSQAVDAARRGTQVLYAEEEVDALLNAAHVRTSVVQRKTSTLADWVAAFPQHIFLLATMGDIAATPAGEALPGPFSRFLHGTAAARAAILGTGAYAAVQAVKSDGLQAQVVQTRGEVWQRAVRFPLDLRVTSVAQLPYPKRQWPLVVASEPILESGAPGLAVAVVDPALGIVVRRGAFVAGEHVDFTLRQVRAD